MAYGRPTQFFDGPSRTGALKPRPRARLVAVGMCGSNGTVVGNAALSSDRE
jgi:hypothetical protein